MTMAKLPDRVQVRLKRFSVALQIGLGERDPPLALVFDVVQLAATEEACRIQFSRSQYMQCFDLIAARFEKDERFFILRWLGKKIRYDDRHPGLFGLLDIGTHGFAQIRLACGREPLQERRDTQKLAAVAQERQG